jgi:hypothetical protein
MSKLFELYFLGRVAVAGRVALKRGSSLAQQGGFVIQPVLNDVGALEEPLFPGSRGTRPARAVRRRWPAASGAPRPGPVAKNGVK